MFGAQAQAAATDAGVPTAQTQPRIGACLSSPTSFGKVLGAMAFDETCPVCRTAEIVCGKWTLLLVRDLAEGRSRFCELERSLAGISPRTLSLRLRGLEEEGIVLRHTYPEVPPRVEYALTEKGRALLPLIDDMRSYGSRWLCEDAPAPASPQPAVAA
jgi:DNA-binding HxlR family transcriptional regulator